MSAIGEEPRSKLRRLFRRSEQRPTIPDGFTPITEFDARDIFIAGYPKSGNTWFQDLVAAVVYGMMPEYCPPLISQELVADVHAKQSYRRYATPMYFKTHHLPRPEYKRVVWLVRDGRDAMVSYLHHLSNLADQPVDFLQMVRDGVGLFPAKWHEHVEQWLANPYQAEMIRIKYEDLKRNTTQELERFCKFAGVERDPAFLGMMAKATAFEKMQSKESRVGVGGDPRWPKDKLFRRRGQVGSYKDEMPPEVLEVFLREASPTLRKLGYGE